jgi:glucokinase
MVTVADIGATKTMIALAESTADRIRLSSVQLYLGRDYDSFESVLEQYINDSGVSHISSLCIGIAGPVKENSCRVTNLSWSLDGASISRRFGIERVVLLNDLVASGYGIEKLSPDSFEIINAGQPVEDGNRLLISPGTGLGETIIHCINGKYIPVASEGGHADFAPYDGTTRRLWEYIKIMKTHVSVEDLLSGPGFPNIYRFLVYEGGSGAEDWLRKDLQDDPGRAITTRALEGTDRLAAAAVKIFLDILAAEAGNMALKGLTTGGVYIGGGIVPRILPLLDKKRFAAVFSDNGKHRSLLESFPINIVTDTKLPLYGAAGFILSPPQD